MDSDIRQEWEDLAEHVAPRLGLFRHGQGRKAKRQNRRNRSVMLDSHAAQQLRVATSGIHFGLTNPTSPWFHLQPENDDLTRINENHFWLEMMAGPHMRGGKAGDSRENCQGSENALDI